MSKKVTTSNQEPDISELVNEHVNNLDDKGKLQLPDDMPDWQKHVIRGETRTRDAQAALSNTQTQLRESEAKNGVLMETASTMVPANFQLSDAELAALNALKVNDPDKYRLEVNSLEAKAREAQATNLTEMTTKAANDATNTYTAKNRVTVLAEFRDANPDLVITDDVLVNDVPPRFINGVTNGDYSYAEYLNKIKVYLEKGKNVNPVDNSDPHNIHNMSGSQTPGKVAANNAGKQDYKKMTF